MNCVGLRLKKKTFIPWRRRLGKKEQLKKFFEIIAHYVLFIQAIEQGLRMVIRKKKYN